VNFQVSANAGASRQQTIIAAGATFTVSQSSGCSFSTFGNYNAPMGGGTSSFPLTATDQSCAWTATLGSVNPQGNSFISITSGSGTGNGTVTFQVAANNTGASRQQTITVTPGATFFVSQSGAPDPPVTAPGNFRSVPRASQTIALFWTASYNGAFDGYNIQRSALLNGFAQVNVSTGYYSVAANDITVSPNTAYLYKVCAAKGGCVSNYSNTVLATTVSFSDEPLIPGVSAIKADHLLELRTGIDAVRRLAGLSPSTWSAPGLQSFVSGIRAQDIQELRDNLAPAVSALQIPAPAYADPQIIVWLPIKAAHIEELRAAVNGYAKQ
jgi:hypothetical protein